MARRQYGLIARRQLLACGLSKEAIDHRLRRGRLHRARRGVYVVGRPELSPEARRMATVLAAGPGAVLSHGSAAEHWGLSAGTVRAARSESGLPEVTVPRRRRPRPAGIVVHRRPLPANDLTEHRGIPVISPLLTLIDLATRLGELEYSITRQDRVLEGAINELDRLDLLDPETIRTQLDDRSGERGVHRVMRVLDKHRFTLTDSELERRFLRLARDVGLRLPETGARVRGFKLDFLWRDLGLAVETDGLRYHRTAAQQARDRRRDQVLAAAGLTPLRFTYAQVASRPEEVAGILRAVVARLKGAA